MSKPYTAEDLTAIFDAEMTWRRKELSDLKAAIRSADGFSRPPLIKAVIAMSYAHWEGYVRTCATRYFEHLTLRKRPFMELERQIYVNSMLSRVEALHHGRVSLKERCKLVNDILDGGSGRFAYLNPDLIDTHSNLNTGVVCDICTICGVDSKHFEDNSSFLDLILLRRRNAIAHGEQDCVDAFDVNVFVANVLSLMAAFRNLLENKIYLKAYVA